MAAVVPLQTQARRARWLRPPRWTVRLRFTLLYGALFVFSGAGVIAVTYWLVDRFLASVSPLKTLGIMGPLKGGAIVTGGPGPLTAIVYKAMTEPPGPGRLVGAIVNPGPGPLATRSLNSPVTTFTITAPVPSGTVFVDDGGQAPTLIVESPKQLAAQATLQHNDELHQLLFRSGLALAIVAVIAVGLGWFLAGRVLRPLRAMATTTQQISEENLHRRLDLSGPRDELRDLGDTIDRLLARLEGAFEAQRSFVANASHELRTPLTLARALLQMRLRDPGATIESYRSTCEEVLAAEDEQEQLIDSLLVLARSQHGAEEQECFDIAEVVGEVVEASQGRAADSDIRLSASLAPAQVRGDASLVHRLVSNLVDNALRYNEPGGHVDVQVSARGGWSELQVANSGEVVPLGELERLLQPFQRLAVERGTGGEGLGLGLSIVAAVAKAHQAVLEVSARPEGGLSVAVRFPAPAATPPSGH
jgi:signal transduction histidine kinase